MGRYVGNIWHEELPDPGGGGVQGNNIPVTTTSSGGGGGGGSTSSVQPSTGGYYQTKNGLQTLQTMEQQLRAVGWQGGEDVASAYARTTGGGVTPAGGTSTGGAGAPAAGGGNAAAILGKIQQDIVNSLASGNKAAFDEAVREFNQTFGLDQAKFAEATRQFNQTFGLQQAGVTGTYNGAPTEARRQFDISTGLNAAQLAASLHADPFRQREVEGQLGRLLQGQGVAGFQSPTGSAADTSSIDYIINQIRNPNGTAASSNATLNAIPAPNQVNATEFLRSSPGTQQMVLSGIKAKYGLDPEDALAQIKATLPQFASPATVGAVRF